MKHQTQLLFRIHLLFVIFQRISATTVTVSVTAMQPTLRLALRL
jgi:hypothetical protein